MAGRLVPADAASALPVHQRARTRRPRDRASTTCSATTLSIDTHMLDGDNKRNKTHNDNKSTNMLTAHARVELRAVNRVLAVHEIDDTHAGTAVVLLGACTGGTMSLIMRKVLIVKSS